MRLGLEIGAAGDGERKSGKRLYTPPPLIRPAQFVAFINSLPLDDKVKGRLIKMSKNVPSMTLGQMAQNIHTYIRRVESQIKQEELRVQEENRQYEIESQAEGQDEEIKCQAEGEESATIHVCPGEIDSAATGLDEDQGGRPDVPPAVSQ